MKTFTETEYLNNPRAVFDALKETDIVDIVDAGGASRMRIWSPAPDTREDWQHVLDELRHTKRNGDSVKVYILTEADFEKLDLIFRMLEAENKDPVTNVPQSREDLKRVYRYHLYRWIGEVKGDSDK